MRHLKLVFFGSLLATNLCADTTFLFKQPNASAPPTIQVSLDDQTVQVNGASPGGTVILFGAGRVRHQYWSSIARREYVLTADNTGSASTSAPTTGVIWCAVDVATGQYAIAARNTAYTTIVLPKALKHGIDSDTFGAAHGFLEALWVRPRVGGWAQSAGDGGEHDSDHSVNGRVVLDPASMRAISNAGPPPKRVLPGDSLILIDPYSLQVFATQVQK